MNITVCPSIKTVGQRQIQQLSRMMEISPLTQTSFRLDCWGEIAATNCSEDNAS